MHSFNKKGCKVGHDCNSLCMSWLLWECDTNVSHQMCVAPCNVAQATTENAAIGLNTKTILIKTLRITTFHIKFMFLVTVLRNFIY